jgi:hypothetical protein
LDIKYIWPKVLKLESEILADGGTLSRGIIKRRFKLTENGARFIYEALKHRKTIAGTDLSSDVVSRENLSKRTKELKDAREEIQKLTRKIEIFSDINTQRIDPQKVFLPGSSKKGTGIATVLHSDVHLDECVEPAEIGFVNAYSREIADARLDKFFKSIVRLSRDYIAGINIEALVFAMGGDMISGIIHEELAATNCFPISDTLMHYVPGMQTALECFSNILARYLSRAYQGTTAGLVQR